QAAGGPGGRTLIVQLTIELEDAAPQAQGGRAGHHRLGGTRQGPPGPGPGTVDGNRAPAAPGAPAQNQAAHRGPALWGYGAPPHGQGARGYRPRDREAASLEGEAAACRQSVRVRIRAGSDQEIAVPRDDCGAGESLGSPQLQGSAAGDIERTRVAAAAVQ